MEIAVGALVAGEPVAGDLVVSEDLEVCFVFGLSE